MHSDCVKVQCVRGTGNHLICQMLIQINFFMYFFLQVKLYFVGDYLVVRFLTLKEY